MAGFSTGARSKKPMKDAPKPWRCDCTDDGKPRERPGYLRNCPDCKKKRL